MRTTRRNNKPNFGAGFIQKYEHEQNESDLEFFEDGGKDLNLTDSYGSSLVLEMQQPLDKHHNSQEKMTSPLEHANPPV